MGPEHRIVILDAPIAFANQPVFGQPLRAKTISAKALKKPAVQPVAIMGNREVRRETHDATDTTRAQESKQNPAQVAETKEEKTCDRPRGGQAFSPP